MEVKAGIVELQVHELEIAAGIENVAILESAVKEGYFFKDECLFGDALVPVYLHDDFLRELRTI